MNTYLIIIISLLLLSFVLDTLMDWLNVRSLKTDIPEEFEGYYDKEKYEQSQLYLRENTRFGLIQSCIVLPISIAFILLGGFAWIDYVARSLGWGMIPTGLVFTGLLLALSQIMSLPFSLYNTFVIEEKYGFNRTTAGTFFLDLLKGLGLGILIGAPVLSILLWFFQAAGSLAWLYSWIAIFIIQLVLLYIAPVYIMPLFNKFSPIESGELKTSIEEYAEQQGFALEGIYTMDGSRRSSRANAYFTGFGKMRRIVLFDTLIENHTVAELVGVLAHEVGHYKLKHMHKGLVLSTLSTGLMLYLLSFFLRSPGLYEAFQVRSSPVQDQFPIYAGMVFFGYLYTPISLLMGILFNFLSRKHEFEADAFAVNTCPDREPFIEALKKLTVDNLGNLSPHPFKVWLEYSHPTVLQRIEKIRSLP
jgi:STE24 endopeptidase